MKILCKAMGLQRSSFYAWKKHLSHPSEREKNLASNVRLFQEYHSKYPSHGYRWLNAKIRLDKNIVLSDPYAHKCCKIAGIKSKSKHYRYKKAGDPARIFPNLLLSEMQIDGPMQCIVSDMTAFYVKGTYYELTLYMDLWNNEIVIYSLFGKAWRPHDLYQWAERSDCMEGATSRTPNDPAHGPRICLRI